MDMKNLILGLFYSDKNNLIYEKIKHSNSISEEIKQKIKLLPFKFLGPVFLTASGENNHNWIIEFIEASLSIKQKQKLNRDFIQSFFNLNSTSNSTDDITNLSTLIGSPHTEDINSIYNKLSEYIHPSIVQGRIIQESIEGMNFKFKDFIKEELERGINLLEHSLGSSRKIYWKKQKTYSCIGIIERNNTKKHAETFLYTFNKEYLIEKDVYNLIPSFYVMSILPNFYENLIRETLDLFEKNNVYPNIRMIKLSNNLNEVLYLEEFKKNNGYKKSYGFILIPEIKFEDKIKNQSYFKKQLRLLLDKKINISDLILKINPHIRIDPWSANSETELDTIKKKLDLN